MILPEITLSLENTMFGFPFSGSLSFKYSPFRNLQNPEPSDTSASLLPLSLKVKNAGIFITEPLSLETEPSYDDSINLIVSDNKNPLKLINSRFYQTSATSFEIADRRGNLDTNIYSESNFKVEASLIKSTRTIMHIDFLGIKDGGMMKVGNYTFYLRLADADGNESDFIAESGRVVCHVGGVNTPSAIRGGQQDENSYKIIKLKLNNIDLAYDYINIYYTRSTGDMEQEITRAYKITDKFKVTNNDVELSITGYENHEEISVEDINIQYTNFDSVKTVANCQNITFAGNTTNDYNLFKTLEKYSLFITPKVVLDEDGIGNLNQDYQESYTDIGYEYYNTKNIYYKLGYWDEEIYRVGIVYVLNNYTLSPVFNIRGKKTIDISSNSFVKYRIGETINYNENYLLEKSIDGDNPENAKGVFKIDISPTSENSVFNGDASITPIGLSFDFTGNVIEGDGEFLLGLKDLTKGFFFVRQKRIPTILAQGVGLATSKKAFFPVLAGTIAKRNIVYSYFVQSFLGTRDAENIPILKPTFYKLFDTSYSEVVKNSLLCPEAILRTPLFNTFFNSSEYVLNPGKYFSRGKFTCKDDSDNLFLKTLLPKGTTIDPIHGNPIKINAELTLVEPGIELIRNSKYSFRSKAGDSIIVHKHVDPRLGDFEDVANDPGLGHYNDFTTTAYKIRGEFNTFIGTNSDAIYPSEYYNIFQKNYDFEQSWKEYFNVRYNDSSPFYPISDRILWENLNYFWDSYLYSNIYYTPTFFRGDCYINTFTERIHWNFIDSELPTNKRIIDPYTWAKNFKIKQKASIIIDVSDSDSTAVTETETLKYNKLLKVFTYKKVFIPEFSDDIEANEEIPENVVLSGLLEPEDKKFKKYSTINGLFGVDKINKPDVNAIPLGHWATFKVCSNINLAMRDLDWTRSAEEAVHKQKRGFYPLQSLDASNPLPESTIINSGISKTVGDKYYFEIPDVPFIKSNFATRIYYSNILQNSAFTNGNRVFEAKNYQDYTREYGAITKIVEWYGKLIVVFEHGIVLIPVNERAMMANASGENIYINTENVLPKNPRVITNTFGSLWPESIIKTPSFIYGIDTVGKKIWRTNGETYENISDLKIQKFLNDNIKLKESEKDRTVNVNFIKSHYNAFKQDVLFVFKYNDVSWNLCWNELTQKWTTQYTWFPEFSENINNIFYTFANQSKHSAAENKLYKHGFAGTTEEEGNILPTAWYDEQHPFEYEFVVAAVPGVQKIFNNLNIISNLVEPDSFYFEVVGEGFSLHKYKDLIMKLNTTTLATVDGVDLSGISTVKNQTNVKLRYAEYLRNKPDIKKLPYIYAQSFDINDPDSFYRDRPELTPPFNMSALQDLTIREHNKTKEKLINSYQKGANIVNYGRMKGNMQYLEDSWNIQIQPIYLSFAYLIQDNLFFTPKVEMKLRDKYIKMRVKYTGDQYAVIHALKTLFIISYA